MPNIDFTKYLTNNKQKIIENTYILDEMPCPKCGNQNWQMAYYFGDRDSPHFFEETRCTWWCFECKSNFHLLTLEPLESI